MGTTNRSGYGPNASSGVGDDYPAYVVTWYDALVYCNLRSMAENLTPCYTIGGSTNPADWTGVQGSGGKYCGPSSSNASWNGANCSPSANGYRLPTVAEWKQAADDGHTYSGSDTIDVVAWYRDNSGMPAALLPAAERRTR